MERIYNETLKDVLPYFLELAFDADIDM